MSGCLLVWGGGNVGTVRARVREGARVLAWSDDTAVLEGAAIPYTRARAVLDPAADAIDEAAMAWTKDFGRRPLEGGQSFRELLTWKGVSLWWFAELYLHHSTAAPRFVRLVESFHRLLEAEAPAEVEAIGLEPEDALLLARTCTARGILVQGPPPRIPATSLQVAAVRARSLWNDAKGLLSGVKARGKGPPPMPPAATGARVVLFLSHAAFWRERKAGDGAEGYEHYFDHVIPETEKVAGLIPFVVAVGPRAAFRRRGPREQVGDGLRLEDEGGAYVHVNRYADAAVLAEVRRASAAIRRTFATLAGSAGVAEAFAHRGVSFADLAAPAFAGTVLLQLPWAVRCYEEMSSVLRHVRPAVVCLYAESSGWGRAALAACRASGVPTVALQHGIVYPKYFSYRHDEDEAECPRPDRTAVFGEAARRLLMAMGRYAPESLVLTGSPKFDDLVRRAGALDRPWIRGRLALDGEGPVLLVASRFRAIRDTHQSIGPAFAQLVRAVESLGVRAVVKPHPAEPDTAYVAVLRQEGSQRVRLSSPDANLVELMYAADALVTVESLSALEALVLGRPVVVLSMPTNLAELVNEGVALGVAAGADPTETLRRVLFDEATREALEAARRRYVEAMALGADGRATQRIVALLEETASRSGMVG